MRRSEAIYGMDRAFFAGGVSPMPKVDALYRIARRSKTLEVLVAGTSVAEYGVDPRLMRLILEPESEKPVFNASIGGVSAMVGLDLARDFDLRARWLIVSVSPMDFTRLAQMRGERFKRHADQLVRRPAPGNDIRLRIDEVVGARVRSLVHSSSPLRRRSLHDWLRFLRSRPEGGALAFLNSEAVIDQCGTCWDGYIGSTEATTADDRYYRTDNNDPVDAGTAPVEFVADHSFQVPELEQRIAAWRESGANVILVRVPTPRAYRAAEDREASMFEKTMLRISARMNVPYVGALMPDDFLSDPRNFVDTHHLSYRGSRIFTTTLGKRVRETFSGGTGSTVGGQALLPVP